MDIRCNLAKILYNLPAEVENNLQDHYIPALCQQAELQRAMHEEKDMSKPKYPSIEYKKRKGKKRLPRLPGSRIYLVP